MDESTPQPPSPDQSPPSEAPPGRPDRSAAVDPSTESRLAPDVEQQVRDLLAEAAPIGPMPDAVGARITRALAAEARLRRLRSSSLPPVPRRPAQADRSADDDVLTPLIRQRQRPRPLLAAAAVAAAAAVVAVGGSALHLSTRPSGPAVAVAGSAPTGNALSSSPSPSGSGGPPGPPPTVHIQLSTTAYDAGNLVVRAGELLVSPSTPLREGAAEAPTLGPIATEIGLAACLEALQAPTPDAVHADLATYAGQPAAIIVVTRDGASTAYAVRRSCTTGNPQLLHDPAPLR